MVVYELLDEMLDNGFPLATEANILKEMIKPPNILRTVENSVTGKVKNRSRGADQAAAAPAWQQRFKEVQIQCFSG